MPRPCAPRLLLAAVLLALAATAAASPANSAAAATDFIRKSCRATQYPSVCVQSLSSYGGSPPPRSPRELARAALAVSADRARAASAYVGRLSGARAGPVRDCLENMADSVGHLRDAAEEMGGSMGRAGSPGFKWHLSNVQTWCSAALTDENTCLDGLSRGVDPATRAAIRGKVVQVAQVTSNALALVNRVGPGY
ncbi:21 kDa protein-like [Phragmites australis]|uniref:21 kDa protein-like n=1 Tax=Phragmites australis TaxID=29695 RepID=UPI002D784B94|nr:21 kDa protein-like [Phragmites australis]